MNKLFIISSLFLFFAGYGIKIKENQRAIIPTTNEPQSAFEYLNKIRAAPASFSSEIGVDLSYVKPIHALIWNDTLAKVANAKALDMATRNYVGHIDPDGNGLNIKINAAGYLLNSSWISNKSDNFFESINAGSSTGIETIKNLIIDEGIVPPGHRIHLLGLDSFYASCYDIGIGFVNGADKSNYQTYCCVIIAKHDF